MADVKWIKLATNIFDNRKIRQIECLPDGYAIIVVWVKLLCLAGNINDSGMVYFTKEIPYTEQMLATQFNMPLATVQLALKTFGHFEMIEVIDNVLHISNWEKYQNVDGLDRIREQTRKRVAKHRENQKLLGGNADCNVTVTQCNATEEDKEEDKDKEQDKEIHKEKADCQQIADMYNSICVSLPSIKSLSDARKKAIKARLKTYTLDDFKTVFENAEASSFLKGGNDRNWTATFDWLIKDTNMAKVLDGNYVDKPKRYGKKEIVPDWCQNDDPTDAMKKLQLAQNAVKRATIANNKDLADRAEKLRQKFSLEREGD